MRILIYGINFSPELTGIGKYNGEMAEWLLSKGHEVIVVTAPPYYPEWKLKGEYKNFYSYKRTRNLTLIRCPLYIPSKPSTLKRLIHLISFSISSFIPIICLIFWKPDVILQVAPTLLTSIQTLVLSKLSKAKSVLHIQDFEIDAMFKLAMAKTNLFKKIAFKIEKIIFNSFDSISTISTGMIKKLIDKGVKEEKVIYFPNWSEIDRFKDETKDLEYLNSLGIDRNKKIILYSGNMGHKQGLDKVIEVAYELKVNREFLFVLVGDGAVKKDLINHTKKLNLTNVIFLPLQSYEDLPKLLASADCHLVVQKANAADLVLPSKLTNILSVGGNAVITAEKNTTLGSLCEKNPGIAVLAKPESVQEIKEGIINALSMKTPNVIAQNYSKDFLDKEKILNKYFTELSKP